MTWIGLRGSLSRRSRRGRSAGWTCVSRIRTIKPELWDDELLGSCSISARLLFIGLISNADDEGRLRGAPARLAGRIFQYDELPPRKVEAWLVELEEAGRIVRYAVGKERFIWLPGFKKNQVINKWKASILPPPPLHSYDPIREKYGSRTVALPATDSTSPPFLPDQYRQEWKGMEWRGRDEVGSSDVGGATSIPFL
jgi:hypothetical protein